MRKAFFFSFGLLCAVALMLLLDDHDVGSAAKKVARPKLRATIIFPAAKDSPHLPVSFSHVSHARFGLKCTDCHDGEVFAKDNAMGVNAITMDAIFEGKFCGHCHNEKTLNDKDEPVFGPTQGTVQQCVLCHSVKTRVLPEEVNKKLGAE